VSDRARAVVLLEGRSDIAAVRAAAAAAEVDLSDVRLVDLGGITNVRRRLSDLACEPDAAVPVLGMCDVGEARFLIAALEATGHWLRDASDLPSAGFFVCVEDLEDELLRALGPRRVMGVLDRMGLREKLDALAQQPAWRARPLHDQLHRFAGVASGRKELLAGELTAELAADELPEPLQLLLQRLR
jgi:hypothetical protein